MGDGTIPRRAVSILAEVGTWLRANGEAIYDTDRCQSWRPTYATFSRKGDTLFMHVHFWPGHDAGLSGLQVKVTSVYFLKTKEPIHFTQDEVRTHLTGPPARQPDSPVTTIALECDGELRQNSDPELRLEKPRGGVGMEA